MKMTKLLFSFEGRIGRRSFWVVTLTMLALSAEVQRVLGSFGPDNPMTASTAILSLLWFVIAVWIILAIQVKRWHDIGKTGWWAAISFVPILGPVWVIIQCGFMKGSQDNNN